MNMRKEFVPLPVAKVLVPGGALEVPRAALPPVIFYRELRIFWGRRYFSTMVGQNPEKTGRRHSFL